MFDLRRPCNNCPWRTDVVPYLSASRVAEIVQATAFQCHKTVEYADGENRVGEHPQQCAGLMLLLHRAGLPNQIMQIAERVGAFDPADLDQNSPVYQSIPHAVTAHGGDPAALLPYWIRVGEPTT